jgi:hypothetical protein
MVTSRRARLATLVVVLLLSIHPAWGQSRGDAPGRAAWLVEARAGCWLWHPDPDPEQAVTWSGACDTNGRATGPGIVEWRVGNRVDRGDVEYRDGKRNGRGVYTFANGNRYEGDFRDDQFEGHGVLILAVGARYEGEWRNGRPNGLGVYWRVDGSRYVGQWRDGCFQDAERRVAVGRPLAECP